MGNPERRPCKGQVPVREGKEVKGELTEEREKYKAEIEARLLKFSDMLNEIQAKLKERQERPSDFQIEPILEKHKKVSAKTGEMEKTNESAWSKFKSELDDLVNDIDDDLRKAMAYFK